MTVKELKSILDKLPESAIIYVAKPRILSNIQSIEMVVNMDTNIVDYYIETQEDER